MREKRREGSGRKEGVKGREGKGKRRKRGENPNLDPPL